MAKSDLQSLVSILLKGLADFELHMHTFSGHC